MKSRDINDIAVSLMIANIKPEIQIHNNYYAQRHFITLTYEVPFDKLKEFDDYIMKLEVKNEQDLKEGEKSKHALEIIKECLVSEFKLFEENGEYFILFYFDEIHELTFKLRNKEEYDLLKEVLIKKVIK